MRSLALALGAAAALALTACGEPSAAPSTSTPTTTQTSAPTSTPSPTFSAPTVTPPSAPSASSTPTYGGSGRAMPATVLGTVSARQGECLLFTPGDRAETWVIVGTVDTLTIGSAYTLTGVMDDTPSDTCTQGPVFHVATSAPA